MVISENLIQTVKDNMGHFLDCAFEGKVRFGPIDVAPRTDHDGEENIAIVVVFKESAAVLDAKKLNEVSMALGEVLSKNGFHNIPVESYIAETEYSEWLRQNSLLAPWLEEEDELAATH
jgi:hypothetical protein